MATLERAIAIAAQGHAGQIDKAGAPYILHPLRVMLAQSTDEARIVGVLHDLVEDCEGWTFARLAEEGFSQEILEALRSVTKNDADKNPVLVAADGRIAEESYSYFVRRASLNRIGARVKRADLLDNMDWSRISEPTPRDLERMQRYKKALAFLGEATDPTRA